MNYLLLGTTIWLLIIFVVYRLTGFDKIKDCYKMWLTKDYWTDYNIIEALSWFTKAIIIIPGLVFGIQTWQVYFLALITSATLIWASNKKLLPTLVAFNTLWIWLAVVVILKNIIGV